MEQNISVSHPAPNYLFFFFFFFFYLFAFVCAVFIAACGLFLIATSGGYSSLWGAVFSFQWLLLLWSTGSWAHGLSSCGSQV